MSLLERKNERKTFYSGLQTNCELDEVRLFENASRSKRLQVTPITY